MILTRTFSTVLSFIYNTTFGKMDSVGIQMEPTQLDSIDRANPCLPGHEDGDRIQSPKHSFK
jgi:hypothetical protein